MDKNKLTMYRAFSGKGLRLRTLRRVEEAQAEWHPTKAEYRDIASVIDAAIDLEGMLYANENFEKELFVLRKSLEGIFGHEYGDEDDERDVI